MEIHHTYKKLSVHEKINCRTNTMINRKTGLTPNSKIGRFEHQLSLNHTHPDSFDQPILFRNYMINDRKFIIEYDLYF
jgi:hypothetical protein